MKDQYISIKKLKKLAKGCHPIVEEFVDGVEKVDLGGMDVIEWRKLRNKLRKEGKIK